MEKLLRAEQVAEVLNLRRSTVYSLAHRGLLPCVRLAQGEQRALIRFRPADIQRLIDERTVPSVSTTP